MIPKRDFFSTVIHRYNTISGMIVLGVSNVDDELNIIKKRILEDTLTKEEFLEKIDYFKDIFDVVLSVSEKNFHLSKRIKDIFLKSSATNVHPETVHLKSFVSDVFSEVALFKKVSFENSIDDTATVIADHILLFEALRCLFTNSIEASTKNNTTLKIALDENKTHCSLVLDDNGSGFKGIDPTSAKHLFSSSKKFSTENMGIGVWFSNLVAMAHFGELTYISKKIGVRTVFSLKKNIKSLDMKVLSLDEKFNY